MPTPSMTALPPELWLRVFENLYEERRCPRFNEPPLPLSLASVSLVCSTWRYLAEPLLYRRISIHRVDTSPRVFPDRIIDGLRRLPHRNQFIECLSLYYTRGKLDARINEEILESLQLMTNLKDVHLESDSYSRVPEAIMRHFGGMQIETLNLSGNWCNSMLAKCLAEGATPAFKSLKTLSVQNMFYEVHEPPELPSTQVHIGDVENLLIATGCCPNGVHRLFLWPKTLKRVFFFGVSDTRNTCFKPYDTATFQRLLDLHSCSIESICILLHVSGDCVVPDFRDYGSLRYLELQKCNIFQARPEMAAANFACPHLDTLRIEVDKQFPSINEPPRKEFNERCADWLSRFAAYYRRSFPDGSLRAIHIGFSWEWNCPKIDGCFEDPWPNEQLEGLKPLLASLGIDLTWPKPWMTREEWQSPARREMCEGLRKVSKPPIGPGPWELSKEWRELTGWP